MVDDAARPHIVVMGLMGAGKTTVADRLAAAVGRPWRDSDADIERLTGLTGREVAAADGVDALHRLEEAVLLGALAAPEPAVVAAAGWVVESIACRRALARRAVVVWLEVSVAELARRMTAGDHRRPLAEDELADLAARREPLFRAVADLVVDADADVADVVDRLTATLVGGRG